MGDIKTVNVLKSRMFLREYRISKKEFRISNKSVKSCFVNTFYPRLVVHELHFDIRYSAVQIPESKLVFAQSDVRLCENSKWF